MRDLLNAQQDESNVEADRLANEEQAQSCNVTLNEIYVRTKRNCNSELERIDKLRGESAVCVDGYMWHRGHARRDIEEAGRCAIVYNVRKDVCAEMTANLTDELEGFTAQVMPLTEVRRLPEDERWMITHGGWQWYLVGDVQKLNVAWMSAISSCEK